MTDGREHVTSLRVTYDNNTLRVKADYTTEGQLDKGWASKSSFTSIERILSENYLGNLKMMAKLWNSNVKQL